VIAGWQSELTDSSRITGKPEVAFNADSDDVVPKSASRTSLLISAKSVCG